MPISKIGSNSINQAGDTVLCTTSGNVGIGTSSPATKLNIGSGGVFRLNRTDNGTYGDISYVAGTGFLLNDANSDGFTYQHAGSTKFRIDSSGNVGINTTPSYGKLDVNGDSAIRASNRQLFYNATNGNYAYIKNTATGSGNVLTFGTNADAVNIDSSGNLLVGTTSAVSSSNTIFRTSGANNPVLSLFKNSSANTDNAFVVLNGNGGGTNSFIVLANGNAINTNNSYGAISDARLKENIEDATPKLADLMQVKVRQYNLIADEEKQKQLGVVADELETVFPAMVTEGNDGFKNVKYSVFVPMLIKAIQEQQAIITQLQADVAALKGQ